MRIRKVLLTAPVLAAALVLSIPATSTGYILAGFTLSTNFRDFRVYNSWPINANTNLTPDPNFPGSVGPVLACWKAGAEWSSEPHAGTGLGDPTQVWPDGLGSGGANFDFVWAGAANTSGGLADRIMSHWPTTLGMGIVADTQGPGPGVPPPPTANGWRIRFSPDFQWYDGVGNMPPFDLRFDIQGVATIELGLGLGLGLVVPPTNPSVPIQTMYGTIAPGQTSVARRSIEADDKAGLQVAYGIKSPTKPRILFLQPSPIAAQQPVLISGLNFAPTGNEVWFNPGGVQAATPSAGAALVKVLNLASSVGGTQITVIPPCNVVDGDVFVKVGTATTGNTLSNGFPIHFASGGNGAPCAQCIGTVGPSPVSVLAVPMPEIVVTAPAAAANMTCLPGAPACVSPSQYSTVATVDVGDVSLGFGSFVVDNDNQIHFPLPLFDTLGTKSVTISTAGGSSCPATIEVQAVTAPELDTGPPIQLPGGTFTARMAAPLGYLHILLFSASNLPSCLTSCGLSCTPPPPGCVSVISLGIGNGFLNLNNLPIPAPNAAGVTTASFPIPSTLSGATVYFQGIALNSSNPFGSLPITTITPVRSVSLL